MTQVADRIILSGSTSGKQIKVAATATAGTLIHTAVSGSSSIDLVYIYAYNSHSADVVLTIEFGGTTSPDNLVKQTIPFQQGRFLILDGVPLNGGLAVRAFAGTANVIMIDGYVDRLV